MKNILVAFLLYTHAHVVVASAPSLADVLEMDATLSEEYCLAALSANTEVTDLNAKLLGFAMAKGFWKCAKEIASVANSAGIDVRSEFDMRSRTLQRELTGLKTAIESSLPMSNINPAFQWAQSPTDVFLNVKFAHKLDAPATLNVEVQNVTLLAESLSLRASDGRKLFSLDLQFLKEVVPEESTWSLASVGRMTINIKKKQAPAKWVRLIKDRKKPVNIHRWFEIQEKYSDELEKLDDDDEEEEMTAATTTSKSEVGTGSDKNSTETSTNSTSGSAKKTRKRAKRVDKSSHSPEEVEFRKQKKALQLDKKEKMKSIDAEATARRTEVDEKAKEAKNAIDEEVAAKKKELEEEHTETLRKLEEVLKAATPEPPAGGSQNDNNEL